MAALCPSYGLPQAARQGLEFERQKQLPVYYKGETVGNYIADVVVEGELLVELKAVARFASEHEVQVLNYLKSGKLSVGLLLNFGTPRVGVRRLVWRYPDNAYL